MLNAAAVGTGVHRVIQWTGEVTQVPTDLREVCVITGIGQFVSILFSCLLL